MKLLHLQPEKIIVRMPNWIGDLVMATPVLTDLRKRYPQAEITVMCQSPLSELLKEDLDVDEVFSFTRPKSSFLRRNDQRNIINRLKEGNYDLGILLTNSFSSAWWFWKGGVKNLLGYSGNFRGLLLTKKIPPSREDHQVINYKKILVPLGISISDTFPRIYVKEKELEIAKKSLLQRGVKEGDKIIGISPGAAYGPSKKWPDEKFFELSKKLVGLPNVRLVFLGDETVSPLAKKINQAFGEKIIDLTSSTSLIMLCAMIKLCDLFLTNDSGPMHIAAALKVPLLALFGSTNPKITGPYKHGEVIYKNVSCSPCYKRVCPIDFPCMKKISVEEVYQKICHLIK